MIESQKQIYQLFKPNNHEFKDDCIQFVFSDKIEKTLSELSIKHEALQQKKYIQIDYSDLDFNIFPSEKEFLKINIVESLKNTLIIDFNGKPLSLIDNNSYIDFEIDKTFYFLNNSIAYVKFVNFLKSKDSDLENTFHFIDYFNKDLRKIVLTSLSEKGRAIIKYKNAIPLFDTKVNYEQNINEFKQCFNEDNNHLPKFLKNSLIEFATRYDSEERMEMIFINLNQIITSAKINFEVYLNNLSIDKIKKDYDDYKSKYFNELSTILSKLTQKIIGLPIGISATLFAINKIKAEHSFLIIIIVILIITSIYLSLLLRLNFKDLTYISKIFSKDYETLKENKVFKKYPEELETFDEIKARITDRIKFLKIITESYFWILNISNVLIIGFILKNLNLNIKHIIFISLGELFLVVIARSYILAKEKSN